MQYIIRHFNIKDIKAVNQIALRAFQEYKNCFNDWNKIEPFVSNMASLSSYTELIIAPSHEDMCIRDLWSIY